MTGGEGRLETLTAGGLELTELASGDVVWFQPGTIHRVVNDGDLQVIVVMQNSGLPEAGDAVLTFPPAHLASREAYDAARSLLDSSGLPSAERAQARRDLAVEGFTELKRRIDAGDPAALEEFYAAAVALARPHLDRWRDLVASGPLAAVTETLAQLDALSSGDGSHLAAARVDRIARPDDTTYGMCGRLHAYDTFRRG
jgi:hypothetical protein